jgi:hypothetical protein
MLVASFEGDMLMEVFPTYLVLPVRSPNGGERGVFVLQDLSRAFAFCTGFLHDIRFAD